MMAVATPAMLPVPTREAVAIISAWKEETPLSPSFFSIMQFIASLNRLICTNRVRIEK
jgi:hypothetical protein